MKLPLIAALVSGIALGGLAFAQDKDKTEKKKKPAAKAVTVRLQEQNKSGQSGTARLTPAGEGKTKVEISMKGGPKGVAQPAHVHDGSCPNPDPKPRYPLQDVTEGKSTSEVAADIKALTAGKMAINVHKSKEDIKTYVACGNIGKGGGSAKKASSKDDSSKKMDSGKKS
jgi:hypothetical protein